MQKDEEKITIGISRKNWRRLSNMKRGEKNIRSFDDVLNFLFKQMKGGKKEK